MKNISIVIPCYNVENTIRDALESLERQTYKNIEVICVDDGSNDNTAGVILQYQKKSQLEIKYILTENRGVSSARNIGIYNSNGKYIMFLDADDMYSVQMIEYMVNGIETYNVDTCYCNYTRKFNTLKVKYKNEIKYKIKSQEDIMNHFMKKYTPVTFVNFIYKNNIIKENDIKFNEVFQYGEDNLFFWQYLAHINSGRFIDCPMYFYRVNCNSAMSKQSWRKVDALLAAYSALKYLNENKFTYIEVFNSYLIERTKFSIAKDFSKSKDKQLYDKFRKKYCIEYKKPVKGEKRGRVLRALIFLLYKKPTLFYMIFSQLGKIG